MTNKEKIKEFLTANNFGDEINKKIEEELKDEDVSFFLDYFDKLNSISTHKITEFGYSEQGDLFVQSSTGLNIIKS